MKELSAVLLLLMTICFACTDDQPLDGFDNGDGTISKKTLMGVWIRTDTGHETKAKEYLDDGLGYLGNVTNVTFERVTPFTWTLNDNTLTEVRYSQSERDSDSDSENDNDNDNDSDSDSDSDGITYHETIVDFTDNTMVQTRQEDTHTRHWQKQSTTIKSSQTKK